MADPFTGCLLHVDQLLALIAHISISLAKIFGSAALVLGSVLGMWTRVRIFWRGSKVTPASRRKPAAKRRRGKCDDQGSSAST